MCLYFSTLKMHLLNIPWYENPNIFGANWLMTEWNPSRLAVWTPGESFGMSFCICLDITSSSSFTLALLPKQIRKTNENWFYIQDIRIRMVNFFYYSYLTFSNHFFFIVPVHPEVHAHKTKKCLHHVHEYFEHDHKQTVTFPASIAHVQSGLMLEPNKDGCRESWSKIVVTHNPWGLN